VVSQSDEEKLAYLIESEQADKHLNLILGDPVDNLTIVSDQFDNHLSNIQTNISLRTHDNNNIIYIK